VGIYRPASFSKQALMVLGIFRGYEKGLFYFVLISMILDLDPSIPLIIFLLLIFNR